ncbi:MAG: hypothetical protein KF733_03550 [Fimbriimonadaceae bacterium]|nr:MAG: hypothetical protein KF733_03550 [Fimbriimonadaceae bacterium]
MCEFANWIEQGRRLAEDLRARLGREAAEAATELDTDRLNATIQAVESAKSLVALLELAASLEPQFVAAPPGECGAAKDHAPTEEGEAKEEQAAEEGAVLTVVLVPEATGAPVPEGQGNGQAKPRTSEAQVVQKAPAIATPPNFELHQVLAEVRTVEGRSSWDDATLARAKQAACGLEAWKAFLSKRDERRPTLEAESGNLAMAFNRASSEPSFFAFRGFQSVSCKEWGELRDAYGLLADAFEAVQWLSSRGRKLTVDELKLAEQAAAAGVLVYRLTQKPNVNWVDYQQKRLRSTLSDLVGAHSVPSWQGDGGEPPALVSAAQRVKGSLLHLRGSVEKKACQETAWQAWRAVLGSGNDEIFEDEIVQKTEDLLKAGIPPSNREIVENPIDTSFAQVSIRFCGETLTKNGYPVRAPPLSTR